MNEVSFGQEARQRIKIGLSKVAEAVGSTLGPAGRNVLIESRDGGEPKITNDGVTVARSIQLEDKFENLGASLIRQVAETADKASGDGTTTASVIAHAIISEGLKLVESGANPILLRDGIIAAKNEVMENLKFQAKEVDKLEDLVDVATISAENEEMGQVVAEVVHKIGKDGVVTIEQSPIFGIQKEFIDGMETYGGYIAPFMITDKARRRAVLEESAVLVTDKFLHQAMELIPVIRKLVAKKVKNLTIFALDFDWDVLELMLLNTRKGTINILGVKVSEINHEVVLADIAASCGAKVVTKVHGDKLEEINLDDVLGYAKKIISTEEITTIIADDVLGKKAEYIEALQNELKEDVHEKKKKSLQRRIAKLSGGIAVIRLGAPSDSELSYMRLKLEDTINATQAAAEEGVVAGGGIALAKAAEKIAINTDQHTEIDPDFANGFALLKRSICQPFIRIVNNNGKRNAASLLEKVQEQMDETGYDARLDQIVNMFDAGIIDPLKVTRNSLEKAVSVATLVLTTEVAVINKNEASS